MHVTTFSTRCLVFSTFTFAISFSFSGGDCVLIGGSIQVVTLRVCAVVDGVDRTTSLVRDSLGHSGYIFHGNVTCFYRVREHLVRKHRGIRAGGGIFI